MPTSPFHHILVAWDASPDAHVALELAIRIATTNHGSVTAVSVLDPGTHADTEGAKSRAIDSIRRDLEDAIAPYREVAVSGDVRLRDVVIESTSRPEALLDYAAHHAADLLVAGRRGSSGHLHVHIGPVTERLVSRGHLPVLVTGREV